MADLKAKTPGNLAKILDKNPNVSEAANLNACSELNTTPAKKQAAKFDEIVARFEKKSGVDADKAASDGGGKTDKTD